jgi:hypothetical protein
VVLVQAICTHIRQYVSDFFKPLSFNGFRCKLTAKCASCSSNISPKIAFFRFNAPVKIPLTCLNPPPENSVTLKVYIPRLRINLKRLLTIRFPGRSDAVLVDVDVGASAFEQHARGKEVDR